MSIRYTAMALIGLSDPAKRLRCADEHPFAWDAFADAKADVVARAETLREYLESADCRYEVRSESGTHCYSIALEYGPATCGPALPLKVVFQVHRSTAKDEQMQVGSRSALDVNPVPGRLDQDLRGTGSTSPGVPQ